MLLLLEINFLHLILPVALLLAGWPPPLPRTHPFHRGEGGWCYDHDHGRGGWGGGSGTWNIYIYLQCWVSNEPQSPDVVVEGEELDQQRWGRKSRVITLMLLMATRSWGTGSWNPVICRVFWDTSKRWLFGISEPSTVFHQSFTGGERFFSWWCNCRHLSL